MYRKHRKWISVLLSLVLCVGFLPGTVLAESNPPAADTDYQFGNLHYFSKQSADYVVDSYYYTDDWFSGDLSVRNDALALVSAQLSASVTDDPQYAVQFLKDLGFDARAERYDSMDKADCAYVIGSKTISAGGENRTLTAVAFQGEAYGDKGWQQNVTVNSEDSALQDHDSFAAAARAFLDDFAGRNADSSEIVWLTGQSRGAAIANLSAAGLLDAEAHPAVTAYTFESPAATQNPAASDEKYNTILNYVSDDDPVTALPIWGMTLYGQKIVYNTVPPADLAEALEHQNPDAAVLAKNYNAEAFGGDVRVFIQTLTGNLAATVPTRADYSSVKTDMFTLDGETVNIHYSYQKGLQALCHIIFGGNRAELVSKLSPLMGMVPDLAYSHLERVTADTMSPSNEYELRSDAVRIQWTAAGQLYELMKGESSELPYDQADLYGLLQLLLPVLVKTEPMAEEGWTLPAFDDEFKSEGFIKYIDIITLLNLVANSGSLVFSHHPDVIIARLKQLAPPPAPDNIDLPLEQPMAGDAATAAADQIKAGTAALDCSWLSVQNAGWITIDKTLKKDKNYYLAVTLDVVGHSVPDSFQFTLNGEKPITRTVKYKAGKISITGVWSYRVGEPEMCSVSFDANGHGTAPASVSVGAGTLLKYAGWTLEDQGIVRDDLGCWRFDGWFDQDGVFWEDVRAEQDITLYASWTQLIDQIELTYSVPHVGDSGDRLLEVQVPEGAPYRIKEIHLYDTESYEDVDEITNSNELYLNMFIVPVSDELEFLLDDPDGEYPDYAGTISLNGQALEDVFYSEFEDEVYVQADYYFNPLPASEPGRKFVDVPDDAYFAPAVDWAVGKDITNGVNETHFNPAGNCTRGQMVTFLYRWKGKPEVKDTENPFTDVKEGTYYYNAVLWAVENGITRGMSASTFEPDSMVTRGQAVTFLHRLSKEKAENTNNPFEDVASGRYYYDAVLWAVENGITNGVDPSHFAPEALCNRAQIVTFLYRIG